MLSLPSPLPIAIRGRRAARLSLLLLAASRAGPPRAARKSTTAKQAQQRQGYQRRKTTARAKASAQQEAARRQVEDLPVTQAHAAGIDLGARSHWVCVGYSKDDNTGFIQEFPAHTDDLQQLLAFLRQHPIATVARESTGIHGVPLYELLDANGFEVLLVDPSCTKQVQGRPKTDRLDRQWS